MHYSSWDMHCHLGWFEDPVRTARDAAAGGAGLFAVTVTPREYQDVAGLFQAEKNVRLGAGMHPWWVRDAADADALLDLLPETRFVGEIGLDASARHVSTWDAQLAAFERICAACAQTSDAAAPKSPSVLVPSGWKLMLFILLELMPMSQSRMLLSGRSVNFMFVYFTMCRRPNLL